MGNHETVAELVVTHHAAHANTKGSMRILKVNSAHHQPTQPLRLQHSAATAPGLER
jgi:hypothetical protein